MPKERLQKILAAAGLGSRRNCEKLILQGLVKVNGKLVNELPAFADSDVDMITLDNKKVAPGKKAYFILNKPKGVICTSRDPQGRKKAIDLIPFNQRLFCVGRLDAETTGILLLTNDGQLANKLTHPRYGVAKTYVANIKGRISTEAIERLKKGVWLAEGKTSRASVKILRRSYKESLLEITLKEGRNREIRRLLAKVGYPIKALKRTHIGRLNLRGLGIGKFRKLNESEIRYLQNLTGKAPKK
ncbi:MAG: rRNA pseudouridine synthase [Sedimentisphaerales bacterium]|nr:rRNA pseudouridine synthase [Sedimentisphaerales bacterium]